jgi:signal peptide peptidase SppA
MLDQLSGVWAIEADAFRGMAAALQSPQAAFGREASSRPAVPKERNIAVIPIVGVLTKYGSWLTQYFGGTSTADVRTQVNQAADDSTVDGIFAYVDSPGGMAKGCSEMADAFYAAAQKKPVYAHVEDLAASAGYFAISGATRINANAPALVGSIGTYSVMVDGSKWAERQGFAVHVIKAGAYKGMGELGTKVTDEQLAEAQRITDSINAFFIDAVSRGRKLSKAKTQELADGRIHPAADAKKLGLIDGIGSLGDTYRQLLGAIDKRSTAHDLGAPAARQSEASGPPAKPKAPMTRAQQRAALLRGWRIVVQAEVQKGAKSPNEAMLRAARNHPGLYDAVRRT